MAARAALTQLLQPAAAEASLQGAAQRGQPLAATWRLALSSSSLQENCRDSSLSSRGSLRPCSLSRRRWAVSGGGQPLKGAQEVAAGQVIIVIITTAS